MQVSIKRTRSMTLISPSGIQARLYTPDVSPRPPFSDDGTQLHANLAWNGSFSTRNFGDVIPESAGVYPPPGVPGPMSQIYTYTETAGPFRLGALFVDDVSASEPVPSNGNWERHNYAYDLFYDAATNWHVEFGPVVGDLSGADFGGSLPAAMGPLGWSVDASSQADVTNTVEFVWTNLGLNGALVDTSGLATLADGSGAGPSAGRIEVTHNSAFLGGVGGNRKYTFFAPFVFGLDVDVLDYAGNSLRAVFNMRMSGVPGPGLEIPCPAQRTASVTVASWLWAGNVIPPNVLNNLFVALSLTDSWLLSKGLHAGGKKTIPLFVTPPRLAPYQHHTYQPARITVASRVPVLVSSNLWQSSDTAKITVSGNTFTVAGTGANVYRTLKENWRAWVGLGAGGTGNAEFSIGRYAITKHNKLTGAANAGQDAWGWGSYGWLEIGMVAPAGGTLTLDVSGALFSVADGHEANPATRLANYRPREASFSRSYSVALSNGANTVKVDLLFPTGGGPFYYGRVDRVQLSGFAVGTYTLTAFDLVARENTYLKCDWDRDFMGVHAAQDGAGPMLNLPDSLAKEDETGDQGGAARLRTPVDIGATDPDNDPRTLTEFLAELDGVEGWTLQYDQTTSDAATKDADGNKLTEVATFLPQMAPHVRLTPGTEFRPDCAIRCGAMGFPNVPPGPNGELWLVYSRWKLGAAIEAQGTTREARRGPAGVTVYAVRVPDGVRVASGVTDASGYVTVSPIPPPGDVEYRLEGGAVASEIRFESITEHGAVEGGTLDALPAFNAAMAAMNADASARGRILFVPYGTWRLSGPLHITREITLMGESGAGWNAGSVLLFDAGSDGIIVDRSDTSPPPGGEGDWSVVRDLSVQAAGKTAAADGITLSARARVENVFVSGFAGNGVTIDGNHNANNWLLQNLFVRFSSGHGLYLTGMNANAGLALQVTCSGNDNWGIFDHSDLGNTYVGCLTEGNGNETQGGGYKADSLIGRSVFLGCYSEDGQRPSEISHPSLVIGGTHGAGFGTGTASSAPVQDTDANRTLRVQNAVEAWVRSSPDDVRAYLGMDEGESVAVAFSATGAGTYRLKYNSSTTGWWDFVLNNLAANRALSLSGDAAVEGPGQVRFPNGYWTGLEGTSRYRGLASAAPTTGTWRTGDILERITPVSGSGIGWVCTAGGAPGTWREYGIVS